MRALVAAGRPAEVDGIDSDPFSSLCFLFLSFLFFAIQKICWWDLDLDLLWFVWFA